VKHRIAALLAAPLLTLAMLASWAGPAGATPGTDQSGPEVVFQATRTLHFTAPVAGPTVGVDDAAVAAESCLWDVRILRIPGTGNLTGQVVISCNAFLAQLTAQVVLIWNGNPRVEASGQVTIFNQPGLNFTLPVAVQCLPGSNWAFGSVLVVNYAGLAASDFGDSLNRIDC
jgi:hypothetical protein